MPTLVGDLEYVETNYSNEPLGPSSRSCCKVVVGNSCGSGSLVGVRGGKSLILTNAHVAGTKIGALARSTFPFAGNRTIEARVIMAGYSDSVMMDWAILEAGEQLPLPHVKLSMKPPTGKHYTGGYPRCQGPKFQELVTRQITHSGTVWRWQPNSIGGQSGSGVHSFEDHSQKGLLTWSWGGDGAGQTTSSIWFQYSNRDAVGFPRSPDLIELSEMNPEVENGFFCEANITTLPIWAHLDDGPTDPPPGGGDCSGIVTSVRDSLNAMRLEIVKLEERIKQYGSGGGSSGDSDSKPNGGKTFGL